MFKLHKVFQHSQYYQQQGNWTLLRHVIREMYSPTFRQTQDIGLICEWEIVILVLNLT